MSTLRVSAINNPSAGSGGLAISTTGNVTGSGLDLLTAQSFTDTSTVSINGCFTSTYDIYNIKISSTPSASGYMQFRLRANSTDNSASSYGQQMIYGNGATMAGARETSQTFSRVSQHYVSELNTVSFDIYGPALSGYTKFDSRGNYGSGANQWLFMYSGTHAVSSAFDGITVFTDSGTLTGSVYIYGYRKAV